MSGCSEVSDKLERICPTTKDGCYEAETQVHSCQKWFFKSSLNPNFYIRSPCFLMFTKNSNLQDCESQSKHIWRLDFVHNPSVSNLCHKKENTWFFQWFSSNSGIQSTPYASNNTLSCKNILKKYEYTSETSNCWRKARKWSCSSYTEVLHLYHLK